MTVIIGHGVDYQTKMTTHLQLYVVNVLLKFYVISRMEVKGEEVLNSLSLFSGIGGIDVALSEFVRTKYYCEIDPYCQAVLLSRMASRDIDKAPIWDDIKTLDAGELGAIDIIVGGFP